MPALCIPIWGVNGEIVNYQIRPDYPRILKGKKIKYETPSGTKIVLDIPPQTRKSLGDPTKPLFITEGARKADAAVSKGLCCISLLGVWNFRGTNDFGGKTALPDWESIALKERKVYIVFDNDVMEKKAVNLALSRLKAFLESRGAKVFVVYLPAALGDDNLRKIGLDDFFADGYSVDDLLCYATTELRVQEEEKDLWVPYSETMSGLFYQKETAQGSIHVPLTNFKARVVGDIIEDDGSETSRIFEVEAELASLNKSPVRDDIPSQLFSSMRWVASLLGPQAVIYPNMTEHARAAIQSLSQDVEEYHIYTHTGWRKVDGEWMYLHKGGAINESGSKMVAVRLPQALNAFELPDPPRGQALIDAFKATLRILEVAPDHITIPLVGSVFASVLGEIDFEMVKFSATQNSLRSSFDC